MSFVNKLKYFGNASYIMHFIEWRNWGRDESIDISVGAIEFVTGVWALLFRLNLGGWSMLDLAENGFLL